MHKLFYITLPFKILGVTSNNASNNDKMIDHLSLLVNNFLDAANQIWCFNHILNLVTKSILCQFNVPKRDSRMSKDDENLLAGLAQELDNETDNEDEEDLTDYNDDDWGNEDGHEGMSRKQVVKLEESLVPVRLMLAKVHQFQTQPLSIINSYYIVRYIYIQLRALANTIKSSSTILLPQWNTKLEELGLSIRMMPHDVSTQWNSTFNMLNFAIDYHMAINSMTSIQDLWKYKLDNDE